MKHFLANSNENIATNLFGFDERLFRDTTQCRFAWALLEGGSKAFMASYNAMNGVQ